MFRYHLSNWLNHLCLYNWSLIDPPHYLSKGVTVLYPFQSETESISHSVMSYSVTRWTVAHQTSLSMDSPGKNTVVGVPFPSPGDLPDLGIKPSLLPCRQILYQLSRQGSPYPFQAFFKILHHRLLIPLQWI